MLNPDELPRRYYAARVGDRELAELLGMCKGLIADGVVNDEEAIALRVWLQNHSAVAMAFPGRELAERLQRVFADGVLHVDERIELEQMLGDLVGEGRGQMGSMDQSTRLPLNEPEPTIFFEGKRYVFTGNFCMSRRECHQKVIDRAGTIGEAVTKSTDYLVVGSIASEAWYAAAWGHKIMRAMDLRGRGHPIAIVSEAHWLATLEYES